MSNFTTTSPCPADWRARIRRRVRVDDNGCWIWQRSLNRGGYGRFHVTIEGRKREIGAHRASYLAFVGDMPADHLTDHLCRVHACVNPEHLDSVPPKVNTERGVVAEQSSAGWQRGGILREAHYRRFAATDTHCPKNHPRAEHARRIGRDRHLVCRECDRERGRKYLSDPANRDRRNARKRERRAAGLYKW